MFFTPKKKRRPPDNNSIINWIIIGAVALAFIHNFGKPHSQPINQTVDSIEEKSLSSFDDYKNKVFPNTAPASKVESKSDKPEPAAVCSQNVADIPYRVATIRTGRGRAISCGAPAKIQITVWDVQGKKIYSTTEPITFTTGASKVFIGLEQGIIGMRPGEQRTLFIPPSMQKTLNGEPPAVDIPLPKKQTILVDVEAVQ